MPKPHCFDPFGSHKKVVYTTLRTVTKEMIDSGFVEADQTLCGTCRKTFFEKAKSRKPPTREPPPTEDGCEGEEDDWTDASSVVESLSEGYSDSNDVKETKREMIIPAMNSVLTVMGESPIKTGDYLIPFISL